MNENTAVAPRQSHMIPPERRSALSIMANRFSVDPAKLLNTLKNTAFKNATDEEMMALVIVANQHGLNPFTREIYAFPAKGGGIQAVVGVDGWIRLTNEHPQFDGVEFEEKMDELGKPISCTAIIHRKDRTRPIKVTEWFDECFRKTEPWELKPRRMLRHKAMIQCARVAFGFAGISDEDDAALYVDTGPVSRVQVVPAVPTLLNPPPDDIPGAESPRIEHPRNQPAATTPAPVVPAPTEAQPQEPPAELKPLPESPRPANGPGDPEPAPTDRIPRSTPQGRLKDLVEKQGFTFVEFQTFADKSNNWPGAMEAKGWADVPDAFADTCYRAKTGLLTHLKATREYMQSLNKPA